ILESARQVAASQPEFAHMEWRQCEEALLQRIRQRNLTVERPLYLLVEKILGKDELIPVDWPIHGTTGYEFLNRLNGLFVETAQEKAFSRLYEVAADTNPVFAEYVFQKKFLILQVALSSELHMLANQLDRLSEKNRW